MTPDPKKLSEWQKRCKASNGLSILLTGEQEKKAKVYQALLEEHYQRTLEYNKAVAMFDHAKDNFYHDLRLYLEQDLKMGEIWEKKIGLDNDAKDDGLAVVNLRDSMS